MTQTVRHLEIKAERLFAPLLREVRLSSYTQDSKRSM